MSFAKKYNKGNVIFDIDISDFSFMKLSDIYTSYGKNVIVAPFAGAWIEIHFSVVKC